MKIGNSFIVENHQVLGFQTSKEHKNQVIMHLDNYNIVFDKADAYEFLLAMLGKEYMKNICSDKHAFEKKYKHLEVGILKRACPKEVAIVIDDVRGDNDFVGICGIDKFDKMVATDTKDLFSQVDSVTEREDLTEAF